MIYNFKDEQRARGIEPQKFDVRVFFAAMVKAEQERFKKLAEEKK
jgi:hypothetical protein